MGIEYDSFRTGSREIESVTKPPPGAQADDFSRTVLLIDVSSSTTRYNNDREENERGSNFHDAAECNMPITRRQILSVMAAPGVQVGCRDYSRCLPDYLRELAQRAYLARNREIAK